MTNFERIKNMSAEELAIELDEITDVRFETCKDFKSYGKKIRATLDVLKWEE